MRAVKRTHVLLRSRHMLRVVRSLEVKAFTTNELTCHVLVVRVFISIGFLFYGILMSRASDMQMLTTSVEKTKLCGRACCAQFMFYGGPFKCERDAAREKSAGIIYKRGKNCSCAALGQFKQSVHVK